LENLIKCIAGSNLPPEIVEYIVVDNKCTDNTEQTVISYQKLFTNIEFIYVCEKNQGCNYARNTGLHISKGDYIIFLDDDVVFNKDFFINYINAFRAYPDYEIFGGKIILPKPNFALPHWLVTEGKYLRPMILINLDKGSENKIQPLDNDYPVSLNMAIKRSAFEKCGFFKTDLGLSGKKLLPGADYELFKRFSKQIHSWIYVADASVEHSMKQCQAHKSYFRRRLFGVGRVSYRLNSFDAKKKLFGLPLYVVESALKNMVLWIKYLIKNKPVESFFYETEMIQYIGCIYEHFYRLKKNDLPV